MEDTTATEPDSEERTATEHESSEKIKVESSVNTVSHDSEQSKVANFDSNAGSRDESETTQCRTDSYSSENRRGESSSELTRSGKKRKKSAAKGGHKVTFTVTISKAIPKDSVPASALDGKRSRMAFMGRKEKRTRRVCSGACRAGSGPRAENEDESGGTKKKAGRILEQPKAQNYYHCEYYLLPGDPEPVKTDVVTFGVAAKIYTLRHEPKVIKTWTDGDITWVAWTESHTILMTDKILEKLTTHTMELRIWDTRDKLSAKARFDRPKAFRLPQAKPGEDTETLSGTKGLVLKQAGNFEANQPKISYISRPLPPLANKDHASKLDVLNVKLSSVDGGKKSQPNVYSPHKNTKSLEQARKVVPNQNAGPPTEGDQPLRSYSRLGRLAGLDRNTDSHSQSTSTGTTRNKERSSSKPKGEPKSDNIELDESAADGKQKGRKNKKAEAAAQAAAEQIKKYGICCIPIKMANFFSAGMMSYTNRMRSPVPGLEDVFFSVALNRPLMSEEQKKTLNPLIIKVQSANDMPNTPINYADLQLKCLPAYVQYQFLKFPMHTSVGRPQGQNVYWDDVNVILVGTKDTSELREWLYGPLLQIEVHDRDRIIEKQALKPTLFGDDLEDEKISNVGTVSSKRTLHNPFSGRDKPWDPYGVAKFDLSGLLLGQQVMNLKSAIRQCPIPDVLGIKDGKQNGKLIGIAGAVDGPTEVPLAAGHYLENSSALKLKVEISHPLVSTDQLAANEPLPTSTQCPFARIVFKFDYKNVTFLSQLQSLVTELNATALELNHLPPHVIEAALSTYKLSVDQQKCRELDIVTGFQLLDGQIHFFILEGLRDGGVQRLWESLPKPENSDVEVLYHSDMSFSDRLYGPLDVDVCRIKLHEPLSVIVRQPLLYVRDMVPKACFEALIKLEELSKQTRLRDAVRNELFPTAEMVISMSREFGVPLTAEDFEELQAETDKDKQQQRLKEVYNGPKPSREWTPIDNHNEQFVDHLQERSTSGTLPNFIAENKDSIRRQSELNFIERSKTMPVTVKASVATAHNYSAQTLNSTEMAKEQLRQELGKNPDIRYTYCPEYHHSMTVVPVNVEALRKQEKEDLVKAFRTPAGWTYPGKKTMIESNVHPKKPDTFRTKQLYQPWAENTLHSTVLAAPLERDRYTWSKRQSDFDVWSYPNPVFNPQDPISIQLAGEKLRQEKLDAKKAEKELWQSKVLVDDPSMYFWRCATQTEMRERGFKSSNQLERLRGMLKDHPQKAPLRAPGISIPLLNVVLNPSVDTEARLAGMPIRPAVPKEGKEKIRGFNPGPHQELSWVRPGNHISCQVYDHDKFTRLKGADFNVHHKDRPRHYKRHIEPLSDVEYSRHLFRWPTQPDMAGLHGLTYQLPDLDEFKRQQSFLNSVNGNTDCHCVKHPQKDATAGPLLQV